MGKLLDDAWSRYGRECEEARRLLLAEEVVSRVPKLAATAHYVLHQTQALAYNLAVAPRQDYPYFFQHLFVEPLVFTAHLPCPDFVYRLAFVNGRRTWSIHGHRNRSRWVDVQVLTGWWGEPGQKVVANYDLDTFRIESDGSFTLIASAEPQPGNWLKLDASSGNNVLLVRDALCDWDNETAVEWFIDPADEMPPAPWVYDEAEMVRRLDLAGKLVKYSIAKWTAPGGRKLLAQAGANRFITRRGDGNRSANPNTLYSQGVYEVGVDEALIIEDQIPAAPYWSIYLGNWWWDLNDYTHFKSSINAAQAAPDSDGRFRAVIAHRDPGVPNWLDPTGWETGLMLLRWSGATLTSEPNPLTKKVLLAELRRHLPADTPVVTAAQRKQEIERRRRGSMRRYGL